MSTLSPVVYTANSFPRITPNQPRGRIIHKSAEKSSFSFVFERFWVFFVTTFHPTSCFFPLHIQESTKYY